MTIGWSVARGTVGVLALATAALSCTDPSAVDPVEPIDRAVTLQTTACGHASHTSGAGIVVGDDLVLAAAHVVIGAGSVVVTRANQPDNHPDGDPRTGVVAQIVHVDTRSDLALLHVPGVTAPQVELAEADRGDVITIAGGGPSGEFDATITRRVEVRIDEVRSTIRSSRFGYELDHRVALGDSGAGAFDSNGRLVAVIYGRSQSTDGMSFAVRSDEIAQTLNHAASDQVWTCNPVANRITPALSAG